QAWASLRSAAASPGLSKPAASRIQPSAGGAGTGACARAGAASARTANVASVATTGERATERADIEGLPREGNEARVRAQNRQLLCFYVCLFRMAYLSVP